MTTSQSPLAPFINFDFFAALMPYPIAPPSYRSGSIFAMRGPVALGGNPARRASVVPHTRNKECAMAYDPGRNPFNPLMIGAIAVIVALVAFLVFRDSSGTQQQAGIGTAPPPVTTPAPGTLPAPGSIPQKSPSATQ
jgi:hypothetical protein